MRTFFLILPMLASLYAAAPAPTVGEIETVETLMKYRASKGNVWKDTQTDEPLFRFNNKNELVEAACDQDITLTTTTTSFNACTIMGGYLLNPSMLPFAINRSAALTELVNNPTWNALLSLAKKYRVSQGRVAKDCLGKDLFEGTTEGRVVAADIRDIVDIPTLIAAIEPVIQGACAPVARVAAPAYTAAELSNYEALLAFRVSRGMMSQEPRTRNQLYRVVSDVLVPAAKDDDVLPNLSNLVALMTSSITNPVPATCAGTVAPCLASIFSDTNLNRLYQLVENTRRAQGRLSFDAIGRALCLETRVQIVDMLDITDTTSLLRAVFGFFPEALRPALPVGI